MEVPIEVKAEENVKAKSLRTFIEKHPNLKGMCLSMLPYSDQGRLENIPLYSVNFCMKHLSPLYPFMNLAGLPA